MTVEQAIIVKLIARDDPLRLAALHVAMDEVPGPENRPGARVRELIEAETRSDAAGVRVEPVFGAFVDGRLASAVAVVDSPGRSALVFAPQTLREDTARLQATTEALSEVLVAARHAGVHVLQALVTPDAMGLAVALERAGFRYLTRLLYLERPCDEIPVNLGKSPGVDWLTYTPQRSKLFCEALEASYAQTLDCKELVGLRRTEDVLAGHRAAGAHDPNLWWVAMRGSAPVGVLLLARIPSVSAIELVYIGVAQPSRGQGFADVLLRRAAETVRTEGAKCLTLAVDRANRPARSLYARWGFRRRFARDAWIASPHHS